MASAESGSLGGGGVGRWGLGDAKPILICNDLGCKVQDIKATFVLIHIPHQDLQTEKLEILSFCTGLFQKSLCQVNKNQNKTSIVRYR